MITRPASPDDLPALTALQRRVDTAWFGAPEHDEDELAEQLRFVDPLATNSLVAEDAGRLVGAAWWWGAGASLLRDPDHDTAPLRDALLRPVPAGQELEVLRGDSALQTDLAARGRVHRWSTFELLRDAAAAPPTAPDWPDGVVERDITPDDLAAVHRLVFVDAGWADVEGHHDRPPAEWRDLFLPESVPLSLQLLAVRDGRPIGVAVTRIWSDGTGWVSQLAVARSERGRGVGRALLDAACCRLLAAGAEQLGLGVLARNERALGLYRAAGFAVDREWQTWAAPATPASPAAPASAAPASAAPASATPASATPASATPAAASTPSR